MLLEERKDTPPRRHHRRMSDPNQIRVLLKLTQHSLGDDGSYGTFQLVYHPKNPKVRSRELLRHSDSAGSRESDNALACMQVLIGDHFSFVDLRGLHTGSML